MKNRRYFSIILIISILFSLCVHSVTPLASAFSDKTGSITLSTINAQKKEPIENVTLRLYQIADAKNDGSSISFTYVNEFRKCNMPLGNLQDSYLPLHLSVFATEHNISYIEKKSDSNGKLTFDNLSPGAYLISASPANDENLMISPFIVSVPIYDAAEEIWIFDINATPKIKINEEPDKDDATYISVKKKWANTKDHPDTISVSLLCDFKEVETIELNAENNWFHRWDNLSKNHSWNVVENSAPDGYSVSYDTSNNTVIIINTKLSEEETTTEPSSEPTTESASESTTEQTSEQTTEAPSESTTEATSEPTSEPSTKPKEETTSRDELIHTGQLNWPVPVLAVAGILLFSIGWAIINFGKKENA